MPELAKRNTLCTRDILWHPPFGLKAKYTFIFQLSIYLSTFVDMSAADLEKQFPRGLPEVPVLSCYS